MKAFEEKLTAWIDGQLAGAELAAFERELAAHPEAAQEKKEALQLRAFLRAHPANPPLGNGTFFNHQLTQRLAAETTPLKRRTREPAVLFSLWRLVAAGAFFLLLTAVLFKALIPPAGTDAGVPYFAQIVEAWPSDPSISATTVYNASDNVTVLWLDGLDFIPASMQLH